MSALLLRVSGVSKAFAAPVLKSIDFSVAAGEVVALTGENGAGKSTLCRIVAGLTAPDSGSMMLNESSFSPRTRAEAERSGVRMVLQELSLVSTLSVAENLQLGHMPSKVGFIKVGELQQVARECLQRVGLTRVDPATVVADLGIGQQQLVEIARGLAARSQLLLLDEPTAMLTGAETERLFDVITSLKAQGVGVIYISHRLEELTRICERVVVLRDGQLIADRPTAEFAHDDIVRAMVGRDPDYGLDRPRRKAGRRLLKVDGLSGAGKVFGASFEAHAGEILGIAGLVGSGRTELLRLIFGASPKESGEVYVRDGDTPAHIESPHQAVACGIGMLPEDRAAQGLLLSQSLSTNITLANVSAISRWGFIDRVRERSVVEEWLQRLRIRARGGDQRIGELSGGNQQKALLARWVFLGCHVLLLDEPTRGVDIGARTDIYFELDTLASMGKALVIVSSDLHELMLICDRIAVMSAGKLVRIFQRGEWSERAIVGAAFSAYSTAIN